MIEVSELTKNFGKVKALDGVSFSVEEKECFALLGLNGAGKTTLINILTTVLLPTSGSATVCGFDVVKEPYKVKERINISPQELAVAKNLTVEENLTLGGYTSKTVAQGIERSYDMFPRLRERRDQRAGTMSGGEQQMLAIARGLMANPKVLLLDEPSLGLAPLIVNDIMKIIQDINIHLDRAGRVAPHYLYVVNILIYQVHDTGIRPMVAACSRMKASAASKVPSILPSRIASLTASFRIPISLHGSMPNTSITYDPVIGFFQLRTASLASTSAIFDFTSSKLA
jgi:branched-chain amino acid transport system ATP-binding protein